LGEKKAIVRRYMFQGLLRDKALKLCGISKGQFYHTPSKHKKRGRKPTKETIRQTKSGKISVKNSKVVKEIEVILGDPLQACGYHRMTGHLQLAGYYINHKKVYRLMKSRQLLHRAKEKQSKNYVKYRVLAPDGPLRLMEVDIKYVWVAGARRNAYVLTIIDVFSRVVLYWAVDWQMKQKAVQEAWEHVIEQHLEPAQLHGWELDIEVRSDNGPQFSAKKLGEFLKENYLIQTFTHPYTPQENGHIESFHAILGNSLREKIFVDLVELREELEIFYDNYNTNRIHGSTLNLPPMIFWQQWNKGNIERIVLDEKKRKVRFKLLIPRQMIRFAQDEPVGNRNPEGGLCLDFEGSMPDKSILITQLDGAVPSQPAV